MVNLSFSRVYTDILFFFSKKSASAGEASAWAKQVSESEGENECGAQERKFSSSSTPTPRLHWQLIIPPHLMDIENRRSKNRQKFSKLLF